MDDQLFKEGDYIRVRKGTVLESGEKVEEWAGRIQEVYADDKCCLVDLDTQTINSLEIDCLLSCIEDGTDPSEYVFEFKDIELAKRRDTLEHRENAIILLSSRVAKLEGEPEQLMEDLQEQWIDEFAKSELFKNQTEYQRESSGFIIDTFMDYLYNYEYVTPDNWSVHNVREICLKIAPRKVTSEIELFENYGEVVENFITFLGQKNYVKNSNELVKSIRAIKERIPMEARNPANWGMAKSMMMGAQESGVDLDSEVELEAYLLDYNEQSLNYESRMIPLRSNPFKEIGRNQKITVKYSNGELKKDIKYKKVEQDLTDGKCEIINK